jgi:hypothetical protein
MAYGATVVYVITTLVPTWAIVNEPACVALAGSFWPPPMYKVPTENPELAYFPRKKKGPGIECPWVSDIWYRTWKQRKEERVLQGSEPTSDRKWPLNYPSPVRTNIQSDEGCRLSRNVSVRCSTLWAGWGGIISTGLGWLKDGCIIQTEPFGATYGKLDVSQEPYILIVFRTNRKSQKNLQYRGNCSLLGWWQESYRCWDT